MNRRTWVLSSTTATFAIPELAGSRSAAPPGLVPNVAESLPLVPAGHDQGLDPAAPSRARQEELRLAPLDLEDLLGASLARLGLVNQPLGSGHGVEALGASLVMAEADFELDPTRPVAARAEREARAAGNKADLGARAVVTQEAPKDALVLDQGELGPGAAAGLEDVGAQDPPLPELEARPRGVPPGPFL